MVVSMESAERRLNEQPGIKVKDVRTIKYVNMYIIQYINRLPFLKIIKH